VRVEFRQLEQYLDQTLGVTVALSPWPGSTRLAPFLRELYSFRETRLLGTPCLLMVDAGQQEQAAVVIRKHMTQVRAKWPDEIIYVRAGLTPYNRKRLVEQKVPFVIPGNQMYLPMLGVDFRERFKQLLAAPNHFSPATQAMVIHWLLKGTYEPLTPAQMAKTLGYTTMTMTRAFSELEAVELGEVSRHGKERRLRFVEAKNSIWAKAQPFLRNSVTKRLCIPQPHRAHEGIQAGLEALAHYSMLAPPGHPVVAVYGQDPKWLPLWHNKTSIPSQDPDALEVEVWSYKPSLFADQGVVDRLSLYLSLKDNEDERVQAALAEIIGRIEW
jgi:DNA-binding MarR family transcriptional regulator